MFIFIKNGEFIDDKYSQQITIHASNEKVPPKKCFKEFFATLIYQKAILYEIVTKLADTNSFFMSNKVNHVFKSHGGGWVLRMSGEEWTEIR